MRALSAVLVLALLAGCKLPIPGLSSAGGPTSSSSRPVEGARASSVAAGSYQGEVVDVDPAQGFEPTIVPLGEAVTEGSFWKAIDEHGGPECGSDVTPRPLVRFRLARDMPNTFRVKLTADTDPSMVLVREGGTYWQVCGRLAGEGATMEAPRGGWKAGTYAIYGADAGRRTRTYALELYTINLRAGFEQCAATYADSHLLWAAQSANTRKAILASEALGFYEGYERLITQHGENCRALKRLRREGKEVDPRFIRRTRLELELAWARFLIRHDAAYAWNPNQIAGTDLIRGSVPFGDSHEHNLNEYCYKPGATVEWLTDDERTAWFTARKAVLAEQARVFDALAKAYDAVRLKRGFESGRVKAIKTQPDGRLVLSMKAMYGGSECVHTGMWRWAGNFWTDCDYRSLPEKEVYPFTVTLPKDRMPKPGIRVGDRLTLWGFMAPGPDERAPKEGATYQGQRVIGLTRGGKDLLQITLDPELICR